jgi:hypothetical protein
VHLNLVGAQSDPVGSIVQSEPGNLAATMRGGGSVKTANVTTVTIDQSVGDREIEVLLLTCQGFEYEALLGASALLVSRKIRFETLRDKDQFTVFQRLQIYTTTYMYCTYIVQILNGVKTEQYSQTQNKSTGWRVI